METARKKLREIWFDLVKPHHSIEDEVLRLKARLLNTTLIVLFLSGVLIIGALFIFIPRLRTYPGMQLAFSILLGFPILLIVNKKGHFYVSATLLVVLVSIATFVANFTPKSAAEPAALVVLPVFIAAFFLQPRIVPILTLIQLGIVGGLLMWAPGLEMPEYLYAFVTIIFLDISVNLYIYYQMWVERFRQNILVQNEKRYSENLEKKVEERTRKLVTKTKELESFSYSISHDLRAPLRHIAGYGQIIVEDHSAQLDPEGKTYLKRIAESAQRMNQLIDDLLLLSKVSQRELTIESINASSLVKEVLGNFQQSDPKRDVEYYIAEDIIVHADKNLFLILLENLVGNSWKFTSKKSPAVIEFGEILENDVPTYFIKDNGVGFNQALSDKIFLPFQRLHEDERFDGTGIGLAIVKRIIDMHSGEIWVESEINQGTIFYFSLGKLTNAENWVSSKDVPVA